MTKVPGHNRSCASRNNHFVSEKTNNLGINILNALGTESIQHRSLCLLAALVCIGEAFLRFYCAPQVHTHTHSTLERLKRQDTEPERERLNCGGGAFVVCLRTSNNRSHKHSNRMAKRVMKQ